MATRRRSADLRFAHHLATTSLAPTIFSSTTRPSLCPTAAQLRQLLEAHLATEHHTSAISLRLPPTLLVHLLPIIALATNQTDPTTARAAPDADIQESMSMYREQSPIAMAGTDENAFCSWTTHPHHEHRLRHLRFHQVLPRPRALPAVRPSLLTHILVAQRLVDQ